MTEKIIIETKSGVATILDEALAVDCLSTHYFEMNEHLVSRVGSPAAKRLLAFAESVRAKSPLPVVEVVLFGSRARGDAESGSDWDVAVVVQGGNDMRKMRKDALDVFSDLALPHIVAGFHLRPILICSAGGRPDPDSWLVSPVFARNVHTDGLVIG